MQLSSFTSVRWAIRCLAPAVIGVVLGLLAQPGAAPASATTQPSASPNVADFTCSLPALAHGVRYPARRSPRLSGPAVSALSGGAARNGFSLDGKGLVVDPPRPGDVPLLTAQQALCGAMASTGGLSTVAAQGVAFGYGRVSLAKKFFPAITSFPYPGIVAAQNPSVASFRNRLAWVVVVRTNPPAIFSCPAESHPARLVARPSDHGYEVFIVDARSGSDALLYWEGGPGGCTSGSRVPPHVGVAEESVSVPWTLVSRDASGYSGSIAASAFACDKVPDTVLVDRAGPNVAVVVTRPFGFCGQPESIPISLHAAIVTANLPETIGHDPVGLLTGFSPQVTPAPGSPSTTTTTTAPAALVPVDISKNAQTLDVTVGEVVTLDPLPGAEGTSFTNPAVSSNPAVLGPLTSTPQPLVAEFRAWKPGSAEITVPQSACVHPDSAQLPCTGPFVVYVVVH